MCSKTMKIVKCAVMMTILAMGAYKLIKQCIKKHKEKFREEMILIAKSINGDIKNTERRTSDKYHDKNQEKYNKMWGVNDEGKNEFCDLQ